MEYKPKQLEFEFMREYRRDKFQKDLSERDNSDKCMMINLKALGQLLEIREEQKKLYDERERHR